MEMRTWGLGLKWDGESLVSPGPYDVYFIPDPEISDAHHSTAYPHFVYWNEFLVAGPLDYNGFVNFISDFERESVPNIIFNEAK